MGESECRNMAKLATQRSRLVHRYLDLKWQVVIAYKQNRALLKRFLKLVLDTESVKV